MKYLQKLPQFSLVLESEEYLRRIKDLTLHLKTNDFDVDWVEDFLKSFNASDLRRFKNYWIQHGVMALGSIRVIKTFLRSVIDEDFLDQIIKSTKKTFSNLEETIQLYDSGTLQGFTSGKINEFKTIIKNKSEIIRRLESMKTKIKKYQKDLTQG